jgi:hypothetical protein
MKHAFKIAYTEIASGDSWQQWQIFNDLYDCSNLYKFIVLTYLGALQLIISYFINCGCTFISIAWLVAMATFAIAWQAQWGVEPLSHFKVAVWRI